MSKISLIILCGLLGFCPCVSAYSNLSSQQRPTNRIVDDWVIKWEKVLVDAADAMPADKYSFAPTNGEFHGVRTFAEQVKHIAAANFILAASVLGEKPPEDAGDETGPSSIYTKPDIVQYLKDSFVYLHKAAVSIDENNEVIQASPISPLQNNGTRLGLVIEAIFHSADHYGQMVEYLRMNGVVPPASR
jgi:DinB superfamily